MSKESNQFFENGVPPEIQPFWDADGEFHWTLHRVTIQEGRTFSHEAVVKLAGSFHDFIQTQLMKAWDQRGEPPTVLDVDVKVTLG